MDQTRRALQRRGRELRRALGELEAQLAELGPGDRLPGLYLTLEAAGRRALLSAAQVEAVIPAAELRPAPGDVGRVAEEAVALYRPSHPQIRFATELADDLPPHAIDAEALRRALINLLDNAVALLGAGGEIAVRTRRQPGQWPVVLEVADNGPGLPHGAKEQLFLPTFTRRPGGTGLGLAIVHRIVTDHGGRIRAEDNPGGGTRFVIELPAAAAVVADEETSP
jgi:signal transduction histidine kinase